MGHSGYRKRTSNWNDACAVWMDLLEEIENERMSQWYNEHGNGD